LSERSIQHRPTLTGPKEFGWEADCAVPVVQPACPGEDEPSDEARADDSQAEVLRALVEWLTKGRTPDETGRLAHVMAFKFGLSECRTQRELAETLKISEGRVSQILPEFRALLREVWHERIDAVKGPGLGRTPAGGDAARAARNENQNERTNT
jgi:hypothetical protein